MSKILMVDDEASLVWSFRKLVGSMGYEFVSAATAEEGLELARRERPDLILMDVKLPGMDGLAALEKLRSADAAARIVVLTAHGTLDTAVRAMKLGAVEYLSKPVDLEQARRVLRTCLEERAPSTEVEALRRQKLGDLVGKSAAMQEIFRKIAAVCTSEAAVLITGESGTGKELVARAIHQHSHRAEGPFEPIYCASIPETLLESELYGHEKGAFTGALRRRVGKFEAADRGTAFLDEVGEIPSSAQVSLLRFLESKTFARVGGGGELRADVRVIAATHRNLEERVAAGEFREDLYFRLHVFRIEIPPLRDRREDIPLLVAHFLEKAGAAGIDADALELLRRHRWQGNVRELRNAIERAAVLARGRRIGVDHLPERIVHPERAGVSEVEARVGDLVEEVFSTQEKNVFRTVEAYWEKALIRRALERCQGNQVKASELLGINRLTLRKKIEIYKL